MIKIQFSNGKIIYNNDSVLSSYQKFAPFYRAVGKKRGHFSCQVKFLEKIIRQYSINQNVLDASCATGDVLNEVADTFEEINFFGTDGCVELINQTISLKNFNRINFNKCYWSDLSKFFKKDFFNLVFLLGNSISHVDSIETFHKILDNISFIMEKGGFFVFDMRPWEINVIKESFNEPKGSGSNSLFFTNNGILIKYISSYKYLDNRHYLIHEIYNMKTDDFIEKIELSFFDFSECDLGEILISHGFDIIRKYEDYEDYPFLAYLIKKQ